MNTSGQKSSQPSPELATGGKPGPELFSIPDHELLRCIGHGAYGAVWLARNVMGTYRAVKIVHREDFTRNRPFAREYEGLLKYEPVSRSHPNLMQILHVGQREGYFYYVTELADDANAECGVRNARMGITEAVPREGEEQRQRDEMPRNELGDSQCSRSTVPVLDPEKYVPRTLQQDLEDRGQLPVRECVSLAGALASALKHLHDQKLVHRDVKPSNVIFVHGVPKLADIGLVATVGDSHSIVGTEGYLPPEGPGNPQADLYSLGKLLYEVSTGMSRGEYPRLPAKLRELQDSVELLEFNEVLLKACAKDTDRRYHRAADLLADLALLEHGDSVKRLRRLERHHVFLRRAAAVTLAVGLLLSAAWWQSWRAHRIARRHLAQLRANEATRLMVQGEYLAALPWLAGALELDAGDPIREPVHRARMASVLERCPVPVAQFLVPKNKALWIDLSRDGRIVATAHEDGVVRLWDALSGRLIRKLDHHFPVVFCRILPSGNEIVTATLGQKAHLWNLASPGSNPMSFDRALGFGSDSYALCINERLQKVYLSKAGPCYLQMQDFKGPFENLTLSLKLIGLQDTLRIRSEVRHTPPDGEIFYASEFHDSPQAEAFDEGTDVLRNPIWGRVFIALLNSATGKKPGDTGEMVWDNLRVRRYPTGGQEAPWRVLDDFSSGALTHWEYPRPPDSSNTFEAIRGQLRITCDNLPRAQLGWMGAVWREQFEVFPGFTFEIEADLISARAPYRYAGLCLARPTLSPVLASDPLVVVQDRWLVLPSWDGAIRLCDIANQQDATMANERRVPSLQLQINNIIDDFDISPNVRHLACVLNTKACQIWSLENGHQVTPHRRGPETESAKTAESTPHEDNRMRPDGIETHASRILATGVRFSPDNRFLAVSHDGEGIELIRTKDWEVAHTLASVRSFKHPRFSPMGCRLAAVRDDHDLVIWDLDDLAKAPALFANRFEVIGIAFSPDGRYVASCSADGKVRLWDVIQRAPFGAPLPGTLACFSADGSQLLLLEAEGQVVLWKLSGMSDKVLAVPVLRTDQTSATSRNGSLAAEITAQGIAVTTPAGQYSLVDPDQAPLRRVAFTADDLQLIAESSDSRAWIWDYRTHLLAEPPMPVRYDAVMTNHAVPKLKPDIRDRRTLSEWAALISGQQLDSEGGMASIDNVKREALIAQLKRSYPDDFAADGAREARWHIHQAEIAERAMDWESAVFHWEHALDSESEILDLKSPISPKSRLAYARQAARKVETAILNGRSRWSVYLPRPPWATPEMLDLERFYDLPLGARLATNQPNLTFRELTSGVHYFSGTGFDVRGIIQLQDSEPVTIPIGRACRRLHFLHAADQTIDILGIREQAGTYQITYASGATAKVNLHNPEDLPPYVGSFFYTLSKPAWAGISSNLHCATVWSGCFPGPARQKECLYLTRTTWDLPANQGQDIVQTLTLRAGEGASSPLVFAITVE